MTATKKKYFYLLIISIILLITSCDRLHPFVTTSSKYQKAGAYDNVSISVPSASAWKIKNDSTNKMHVMLRIETRGKYIINPDSLKLSVIYPENRIYPKPSITKGDKEYINQFEVKGRATLTYVHLNLAAKDKFKASEIEIKLFPSDFIIDQNTGNRIIDDTLSIKSWNNPVLNDIKSTLTTE